MKKFDFIKNEHDMLKHWDDIGVLKLIKDKNANGPRFRFLDGPVTANASMAPHHGWGRTLKDAIQKYKTLKGYSTHFQNGFDGQGMWVEVEVEKLLGLGGKQDIYNYGLDKFTAKCRERVDFYSGIQTEQSKRLGQIMDWENSYYTNSDSNNEANWHFLKQVHKKGLLKKSYKAMPWCPRCGTSLSEHEMTGSYKEITHSAVYARLSLDPIRNNEGGEHLESLGEDVLIWTTTPWTLSANVAVAVNPDNDYVRVKVKSSNRLLIVGKEAIKKLRDDVVEIVDEIKGAAIVGRTYAPPLKLGVNADVVRKVIPWGDVEATEGSGLVHIAPGCGAEDFELGKKHDLANIIPVGEDGRFYKDYDYLAGLSTTEAEGVVFERLKQNGTMYYSHPYSHNYPFCWRCKTDVVFRLVEGWDISTESIKPDIMNAIDTVEWKPAYLKKSMQNWITNMGDWNISRRRFYGLPLPFYPCENEKCRHLNVIGSRDELKSVAINPEMVEKMPSLHRPHIDEIKIRCEKCRAPVARVTDVGDCWLDAGIAPFSTKGYFDKNDPERKFWNANFPSDVVIEMKEQIRLWFYAVLFMSVVLVGKAPYKTVVGYSTMLGEDGKKQSKTDKNAMKLDAALESLGADAMRYTFVGANPANDMRFGPNMVEDSKKQLMAILNSVSFFKTYADIDKPQIAGYTPKNLHVTDVWLATAVNTYIAECDAAYADNQMHKVITLTEALLEDLSNFYIRTNRRRFWKGESGEDKLNAYWVLYNTIKAITIVLAPIIPFLCEYVWQTTIRGIESSSAASVMLADFPTELTFNQKEKIENIAEHVAFVQKLTTLSHSLRARENLKIKQPLASLYINTTQKSAVDLFMGYLRDELNIKNIEIVTDEERFNIPYLSVNFRTAGKVLGPRVQELKKIIESLSDEQMATAVSDFAGGTVNITGFDGLSADVFERKLRSKTEYVSMTEGEITVTLDTTITEDLLHEGKLRELVRGIQVARQAANLDITTRIKLQTQTQSTIMKSIIDANREKIMAEVLATDMTDAKGQITQENATKIDVDGDIVLITIS